MFARIHVKYCHKSEPPYVDRNWHEVWIETDVGSAEILNTCEGAFNKEYSRGVGADKAFKKAEALQRRMGLPIYFSEPAIFGEGAKAHRWRGDKLK